jgi:hypothetical protein
MNAHVKTYTLTIETDDAKEYAVSAPSPAEVADLALELAPHLKLAICIEGGAIETEALAQKLLDWHGAEFDGDGQPFFAATLAAMPECLEDSLHELVNESQAIRDWAEGAAIYGYSLEQHHADERAMLEVL